MAEPWEPNVYYDVPPTQKYLTLDDQVQILNLLREGASIPYLAKMYERSTKTIRRIEQLETLIRKKYANRGLQKTVAKTPPRRAEAKRKSAMRRIRSNDVTLMRVEKTLNLWIKEKYQEDILVSYADLKKKALSLYALYKPPGVDKSGQEVVFKASKSWLYRFKKRYHLTHLEKTFTQYHDDTEETEVIEIEDDDDEEDEFDDNSKINWL